MPPPGEFVRAEEFSRRRWRRIQHIANDFGKDGGRSFYQLTGPVRKGKRIKENL